MIFAVLGNKLGMTQIFTKEGNAVAATIIKTCPCYITQIKKKDRYGYNAIQIGSLKASTTKKHISKPMRGHFASLNLTPFCYLKEYRVYDTSAYEIGQKISLENFQIGKKINVSGVTIGKGNSGNIKRNAFSRGPMSHGSKHHRLQGSIGAGTTPGRVIPGKKMPGRMGGNKQTIKGLEVMFINLDANIVVIKGSVPGKQKNLLFLKFNI